MTSRKEICSCEVCGSKIIEITEKDGEEKIATSYEFVPPAADKPEEQSDAPDDPGSQQGDTRTGVLSRLENWFNS